MWIYCGLQGRQSLGLSFKPEIVAQFSQYSLSITLPQDDSHLDLLKEEVLALRIPPCDNVWVTTKVFQDSTLLPMGDNPIRSDHLNKLGDGGRGAGLTRRAVQAVSKQTGRCPRSKRCMMNRFPMCSHGCWNLREEGEPFCCLLFILLQGRLGNSILVPRVKKKVESKDEFKNTSVPGQLEVNKRSHQKEVVAIFTWLEYMSTLSFNP